MVAHSEREVKIWKIDEVDSAHGFEDEDVFGIDDGIQGRRLVGTVVVNVSPGCLF